MTNEEFQALVLKQLQALTEGQARVEGRIGNLEEGQARMEGRIGNLEEGQARVEGRITGMETNIQSLQEGQAKLDMRIENEVETRIRALFDDRSINQDYFASIKDSLARIEEQIEYLARRNIDNEIKLREHDRELRLLRIERS